MYSIIDFESNLKVLLLVAAGTEEQVFNLTSQGIVAKLVSISILPTTMGNFSLVTTHIHFAFR